MQLTDHFHLSEFTASETAERRGIDNTPSAEIIEALRRTAQGLERIRTLLGRPIHVTSGYRCLELNRAVGSKDTSQHLLGEAADFICPQYGTPRVVAERIAKKLVSLGVDQLILEFASKGGGWVHVSFSSKPRHATLTIDASGTRAGIV
ncbi:MAG: peptidase M15 [Armatimonadetes bacterium]|nr:peptidase M15 [Armatimonadota bacterium]MBM3738932.1 peptidase M15 [Acidobacteriota bacterium]